MLLGWWYTTEWQVDAESQDCDKDGWSYVSNAGQFTPPCYQSHTLRLVFAGDRLRVLRTVSRLERASSLILGSKQDGAKKTLDQNQG